MTATTWNDFFHLSEALDQAGFVESILTAHDEPSFYKGRVAVAEWWKSRQIESGARKRKGGRNKVQDDISRESVARNLKSAVSIFERWLTSEGYSEERKIEDIPPTELNEYLAHFFSTIKQHTGDDYRPNSLKRLREFIQRYLKSVRYPCSIGTSPQFRSSQVALRERCEELSKKFSASAQQSEGV